MMKKIKKRFTLSLAKGFTMIEMLIVIAVLGILAAALLATIDPFEQMKKARDTTLRNSVIDYMDALTRYYGVTGGMPFGVGDCSLGITAQDLTAGASQACTTLLVEAGELKTGFQAALGDKTNDIFMSLKTGGVGESVVLCFEPDSKSIANDPNTVCSNIGRGCTTTTCFWCTDVTDCGAAPAATSTPPPPAS
ncbi:prepilin-type N-terminal cleavage/methylation domain-containing protein [Candidatus Microgenomates bacterium]|nr:prepilin-type N-terminal cleavage/methylation domain-containing protein [Candidatus Microgenomates bacterium]